MTGEPPLNEVLSTDYGGFNPRFLGLSFYFDALDDYHFLFTALTTPEGSPRSDGSAHSLHQIALTSVIDHEERHYLDFLLSPYSTTVFRMRLQALINGTQAIAGARDLTGDVIPIPLSRWMTMPTAERRAHEAEWSELFGRDVTAVRLPSRHRSELLTNLTAGASPIGDQGAQDQFEAFTDAAVRAYLRIAQLTEGFDVPASMKHLRPPYIHEASALSAQLAAIVVGQGMVEAARFASFLLESDAPHARAWQTCYQLALLLSRGDDAAAESPLLVPLQRIPSITTWALFGNHQLDGAAACPTSRLADLLAAVVAEPDHPRWSCDMGDPASITAMWNRWDEATGRPPWRQALAANVEFTHGAVDRYERLRELWIGPFGFTSLIAILQQLIDHQRMAVDALNRDLCQIVDPFRFVQINAAELPHADLRFEFRGWGVDPEELGSGHPITRRVASGAEVAVGVAFSRDEAGGDPDALLAEKLVIEETMEWCDLVFSELAVPDHIYPSARRTIEELTGKRIVQLF